MEILDLSKNKIIKNKETGESYCLSIEEYEKVKTLSLSEKINVKKVFEAEKKFYCENDISEVSFHIMEFDF